MLTFHGFFHIYRGWELVADEKKRADKVVAAMADSINFTTQASSMPPPPPPPPAPPAPPGIILAQARISNYIHALRDQIGTRVGIVSLIPLISNTINLVLLFYSDINCVHTKSLSPTRNTLSNYSSTCPHFPHTHLHTTSTTSSSEEINMLLVI